MNKRIRESKKAIQQNRLVRPEYVISAMFLALLAITAQTGIGNAATGEMINASTTVNAPIDKVWTIVSDIDNEPQYWTSIKDIKNLNVDNKSNVTERDVTLEFANAIAHQIVTLDPQESIVVNQTQGPITGTRTMTLSTPSNNANETKIDVSWNMDFSSIPLIGKGFAKDNIFKETEKALKNIATAAEASG
jgi:uncharacterized membrane protein